MNRFLRGHQVLRVHREFLPGGSSSACWCFCVEYEETANVGGGRFLADRKRVDYKEVLKEAAFAVFSRLRAARKQIAEEEGIPAYAVFTDEQLAGMTELGELNPASLQQVKAIGTGKVEKYAVRLLELAATTEKKEPV